MPSLRRAIRDIIPASVLDWARRRRARAMDQLPLLAEEQLANLISTDLAVQPGDVVFVHSSLDALRLGFPPFRLLPLLRDLVGAQGTLVFPTYPRKTSTAFLQDGDVFELRATPSYMGLLSELARRTPGAIRSLHPTKSVTALGPAAERLCSGHHQSRFPYDAQSPYYRFVQLGGKAIGLGVTTASLSFVHAVEDDLGERFPVHVYADRIFSATCVDGDGSRVVVNTPAHDPAKMEQDVPAFLRKHVPAAIAADMQRHGRAFFRAEARPLFDRMVMLAQQGTTIYPRRLLKKGA